MAYSEFHRLIELLGPGAEDDPKVKGLMAVPRLNPQKTPVALKILRGMLRQEGIDPNDPEALPIVRQLPEGAARIGTVINGSRQGPVFYVPEGSASDLEHVGVFGLTRWGKSYILMKILFHSMLNGNLCWIFDVEDEFSPLAEAVPEPYKPVIIGPELLRINLFQPPGAWIKLKFWRQAIAFLLRSETFIRDGAQNLFNSCLNRLLKSKGSTSGSGKFPSLAETLCYLQGLKLSGSETRGKAWLESLINRLTMLCDTYEETAHVTSSDMLDTLAARSVIFRFGNLRKIPLQFLTNFLLIWLSAYKQNPVHVKKLHTLGLDEQHFFRADQARNDIGSAVLAGIFATGAKRAIRIILSNQLVSMLNEQILGNIGCRICTRLTNPKCLWLLRQSMGLSRAHEALIQKLQKREILVSYSGNPTPFKVRVDEFSFPKKLDVKTIEANAQKFLAGLTWSGDTMLEGKPAAPVEAITGDCLKVLTRIAEVAETINQRYEALGMDRAQEVRARRRLEAKGYIEAEQITVGNKKIIYKVSNKGLHWIQQQKEKGLNIKVKRFKSGAVHEFLLNQVEKNIGILNSQYRFQRNSEIAREHGIEPDSVLIMSLGYRTIIEVCCTNLEIEARTLTKERAIEGVDMVLAVTPNRKTKQILQTALERYPANTADNTELSPIVVLDAGQCLSPKFDWVSVFEKT